VAQATPFHAWRPVFLRLLELDQTGDASLRRTRLRERFDGADGVLSWWPLLGNLLQLGVEDNEHTALLVGEGRAQATREVLLQLLADHAQRSGLLIVLDDAHWLDPASWDLAVEAHRRIEPLLLVLVSRPLGDGAPAALRRLRARPGACDIVLDGLHEDAEGDLLARSLGVDQVPRHLAAWVRKRTLGNPLFSQELVLALRNQGLLQVHGGHLREVPSSEALDAAEVPTTVQGVIGSRIDHLTPRQQLLLKTGSVIGPTFRRAILYDVYPVTAERSDLAADLDVLRRDRLLGPNDGLGDAGAETFHHRLTLDVAYQMMPGAQRQQLHARVAQWYERHEQADRAAVVARLAHHWDRAGNAGKAFAYLEEAGELMLSRGEYHAARSFLERMVDRDRAAADPALVDDAKRARWQRQLADALLGAGDFVPCRQVAVAAAALCGLSLPASRSGWQRALLREISRQALHLALPQPRKIVAARDARLAEAARAATILAECSFYNADALTMATASLLAVNLAERAQDYSLCARSFAYVGLFAGLSRLHALARRYFLRAHRLAGQTADHRGAVFSKIVEGNYHLCFARWQQCRSLYQGALDDATARGLVKEQVLAANLIAVVDDYTGDFRRSLESWSRAHERGIQAEDEQMQVWGLTGMLHDLIVLGRFEEGRLHYEMLQRLRAKSTVETQIVAGGLLAICQARCGERDAALELADATLARIRSVLPNFTAQSGHSAPAEVYLEVWEQAQAAGQPVPAGLARRARAACQAMRTWARNFPLGVPRALVLEGRLLQLEGRPRPAHQRWSRARQLAAETAMPYEEAMASYELGRTAAPGAGAADLQRALALFGGLGCAWHAARAEAAVSPATASS
jgi:tetratricopeptide (TPR) repeat protein